MNLIYEQFLFPLVLMYLVVSFLFIISENKFFKFIRLYWFYKRSKFSYISSFLFLISIGLMGLSLLDLRGPQERIKGPTPVQRTIILIDTSASMLAEDIKPSRLQKAALTAKHFARKAVGHQLSVVVFAEIQKKIVPFTNDLDLIDARLESIKFLRNQNGSSSLTQAIQESLQYFKETGTEAGNILVLTDGEENQEGIELNIPSDVKLALIGIGTSAGGRIPLDDSRGFRFGYKKFRGEDVITKLDEKFFKSTASKIKNARYWITNSYTLPSDEIVEFFDGGSSKSQKEQDLVIRPVLMHWLVLPALILMSLSYMIKMIRIFTALLILFSYQAQSTEEVKLTPEIERQIERLQNGELQKLERLKLADDLSRVGAKEQAIDIFDEELNSNKINDTIPPEAYINYGTTLLEKGEGDKGFEVYQKLKKSPLLKGRDELQKIMDDNVAVYFKTQEQKEQEQKEQEKDQDKKSKDEAQPNKGNENNQGQGSNNQKKQDPKENDSDEQKKKDEQKGKSENDEDKKNNEQKNDQPKDQDGEKKKLPQAKIPAKLKQLMADDRQLQMKMIENGTRELNRKKNSRTIKDW